MPLPFILYVDCTPGIGVEQLEAALKTAGVPFDSISTGTRRSRWVEEMTERVRYGNEDEVDPETGQVIATRRVEVSREFVKTGRILMLTERDKPYAIGLVGCGEEHRATVEAILANHVPFHDHANRKRREVKVEAARRIEAAYPVWKQVNAIRGQRPPADAAAGFAKIDAIRAASDALEARIAALPDADAGQVDVASAPEWPA
jgi:ribosomal protein L27